MLRIFILLTAVVAISVLVKAEGDPARVGNVALIQMQDCLDLRIPNASTLPAQPGAQGLSMKGLGAMLGIGALTIMFFVPAALLSELLMRRDERREHHDTLWERS